VFQRYRADAFAAGDIAHQSDETCQAADGMVAVGQRAKFGAEVKVFALHAYHEIFPFSTGLSAMALSAAALRAGSTGGAGEQFNRR
jgi:hypothetical protein